jgi:hypothetical protein
MRTLVVYASVWSVVFVKRRWIIFVIIKATWVYGCRGGRFLKILIMRCRGQWGCVLVAPTVRVLGPRTTLGPRAPPRAAVKFGVEARWLLLRAQDCGCWWWDLRCDFRRTCWCHRPHWSCDLRKERRCYLYDVPSWTGKGGGTYVRFKEVGRSGGGKQDGGHDVITWRRKCRKTAKSRVFFVRNGE